MRLSEHFSIEEMTASQNAARLGIDNTPTPAVLDALRETAAMMEQVRTLLGDKPITVTSGYRSPALNAATPGSSPTSAHSFGRAADFICPSFGPPLAVCRKIEQSLLQFDQIIYEFGQWTHLAWSSGTMRRQLLIIDGAGTRIVKTFG